MRKINLPAQNPELRSHTNVGNRDVNTDPEILEEPHVGYDEVLEVNFATWRYVVMNFFSFPIPVVGLGICVTSYNHFYIKHIAFFLIWLKNPLVTFTNGL